MFSRTNAIDRLASEIAKFNLEPEQNALPQQQNIENARTSLISHLPVTGLGHEEAIEHIRKEIAPGFNGSSRSSTYYGFVTGGITLAGRLADNLVTAYDQNVQVHLPEETIATEVEDRALSLLCELLDFNPEDWGHRTFTTGATASNVLGLACAREHVIVEAASARGRPDISVGDLGIVAAMKCAEIDEIQVLTTVPHSSLSKAASLVGLGRASVKLVGLEGAPHRFDFAKLAKLIGMPRVATIVAVSASEVNTGLFATNGRDEMETLRKLCDIHGAWIHIDGAFGIMARLLNTAPYTSMYRNCEGLELADSITGDCHKLLNVPYDCGFFISRHRNLASSVFQNPNAAYLSAGGINDILSPLNIGIENSRRFRALPVYATLTAYGREGYRDMVERQVELARAIAEFVLENEEFELLPIFEKTKEEVLSNIFIIVLFRAKDERLNKELVQRIKDSRKVYVSGTAWDGKPACRFAVSNWIADKEKDMPMIKTVLQKVLDDWKSTNKGV
ncbi:pyridoxal-dependent decarboxylase [Delitschia confertaspora ATCC 74209]|uniref:Pyridoxal-dependent decarboxylase n=1 Tax=Delitschia confertaspora ATCC 74209 TaxID=1513339 RepID=A0A9P4JLK8_9PLEO|nr:pyridoxal-dependent decarboxylase [Delitschia confertaspora ATCC 74209]